MKLSLILLASLLFAINASAQESSKMDNSILLDLYQNQHFAEAADYLKKTNPEPVNDLKILSGLAYASQMAGRLPDAETYYERVFKADTGNTAVIFNLGNLNIRRGNNAKALSYFRKILLQDSTNFNVYKQIATIAQNSGDIKTEIINLQKANKINPNEPDVAYDLAVFYINYKQFKFADTVIRTALKADTANLLLLTGKAQIDFNLDKYKETIAECNSLINAGEQTSQVIRMLGTSYFNVQKYNDCISTFNLLEQSQTATETSYYYTAMSYKALKNNKLAIEYFEKAIKESISGNAAAYYGEMADTFDVMGLPKKAVSTYQKSLLYGFLPLSYYSIAWLYDSKLKNKSLALSNYRKFLKSNPPENKKAYIDYAKRRIGELNR